MSQGFRIPADLAHRTDLTVSQVLEILEIKKQITTIQTRLNGLPAKAEKYRADMAELQKTWDKLMDAGRAVPPTE